MSTITNYIKLDGKYNDEIYWKRVNRSIMWLGETEEEQLANQLKLSNAVVGVAGSGGIGGAVAVRLARLGIRHIKVADPDCFDWTNINRQLGASAENVGKNKSEVVGHMANELAGDVTVEIFKDGITPENAEAFVEGCDLVLDQMDFYLIKGRYALHQAFRKNPKTKFILSAWCIGWGTSLYKWTKDGMTIEEFFDIPEDAEMTPEVITKLLPKFMPQAPRFPNQAMIDEWLINKRTVPLFAGSPPTAEMAVVNRAVLTLTDLERAPYAEVLPAAPTVYVYDASTFEGKMMKYEGGKHVDLV